MPLASIPRFPLRRRHLLHAAGSALATWSLSAAGQSRTAPADVAPLAIAQVVDMSPSLQDVGRDFLTGSLAAWQSINATGGIQGRRVRHQTFVTDGSPQGTRDAWQRIEATGNCVMLCGCVGDAATRTLSELQARSPVGATLAQVAPWVQADDVQAPGSNVFGIFPGYREQMDHALKSLVTVGVREIGVAFSHATQRANALPAVEKAATVLGLQLRPLPVAGQVPSSAERKAEQTQAIVLFIGGTPELHAFAKKLSPQPGAHRYIVALADVNLQVLAQLGGMPPHSSVIATQAVPLLTSSIGVVRAYRQALARYYDEPPSPQGLAGFVSARYAATILTGMRSGLTRSSVLQALRERTETDVDGFMVRCEGAQRLSAYVTQTMLTADGRLIG